MKCEGFRCNVNTQYVQELTNTEELTADQTLYLKKVFTNPERGRAEDTLGILPTLLTEFSL